ncbi:restriction endonuclease [Streptomyces sp. NPDC004838]
MDFQASMTSSTPQRPKRIPPGAFDALADCLPTVMWNKRPFEQFVRRRLAAHPALVSSLDFGGTKREVANALVDRFVADEERYRDVVMEVMLDLAAMQSFPNLERQVDAEVLIRQAKSSVADLKKWVEPLQSDLAEDQSFRGELQARRTADSTRSGMAGELASLKAAFDDLHGVNDRQKAGLALEKFLHRLFQLFDLEPRLPYVLKGEQVDGALTFDTDDYVLESKWLKGCVEVGDLDKFNGKVQRKGKNALGLFVSINGFSSGAVEIYGRGTSFITLDGADVYVVLEGRVRLDDLLKRKKRHANETGQCYFPAWRVLSEGS